MKALLATVALGAILSVAPALAAERTEFGRLECKIEGGAGFIIGSSKQLSCIFSPADSAKSPEAYVGTVKKWGLDIGVTDQSVMQWIVLAPTADPLPDGALSGSYVGATAEASVVVGGGANVLVGGSGDTISLQPVSIQGQTGLNLALGVTDFTLAPAG